MLTIKVTRFTSRLIRLFCTTLVLKSPLPPIGLIKLCANKLTQSKKILLIAFGLKIRLNALVKFFRYAEADFWTRDINLCNTSFYCRFDIN